MAFVLPLMVQVVWNDYWDELVVERHFRLQKPLAYLGGCRREVQLAVTIQEVGLPVQGALICLDGFRPGMQPTGYLGCLALDQPGRKQLDEFDESMMVQ